MKLQPLIVMSILAALLLGCTAPPTDLLPTVTLSVPTDTPAIPTSTSEPPTPTSMTEPPTPTSTIDLPTSTPAPQATSTSEPVERPDESIQILSPGPGSRVLSPIQISGEADPTFEQTLVVTVLLADGTELTTVPVQIMADIGQRGPFSAEIPFTFSGETQGFIQVYATSARDGGVTHLSSVGVTFADSGSENIIPVEAGPEQIFISQPQQGETITGGVAHVEGFALAGFEQTLIVDALDQEGNVIGSQPLIVQAPDLGQPGPFTADVPYTLTTAGAGRIVVRDPSPAFGGDVHLSSVEIDLE